MNVGADPEVPTDQQAFAFREFPLVQIVGDTILQPIIRRFDGTAVAGQIEAKQVSSFEKRACRRYKEIPGEANTKTARGEANRTRLRAVIDDVCEERLEEELTGGQPFDDAHGRATAHGHERDSVMPMDGAVTEGGGATARTLRHVARSLVRQRGASSPK